MLWFFLRPGVLEVFSNLHWCSLHFPGAICCLLENYVISGLVFSLLATLHFNKTLVSIEFICEKYGLSSSENFVTLSLISFRREPEFSVAVGHPVIQYLHFNGMPPPSLHDVV